MILNINNKKLTESIYNKCLLLNYINEYKSLKIYNKVYRFDIDHNINFVKNFYKISNYIHIKYRKLKHINKNLKSGILLLSTTLGILTNKKAEMLGIGGVLICYMSFK
ncbi:ribosomal protein S8 (apicoplast) [Babesia ovis]|uniref:Ribosomal protein S8 n=1 Tax=Babesia ovis TaxID=5869 RepID=A0A9W5WWG5_BABOV|nr:ribosomal protein S8 [Babesia ovis]